MDYTKTQLYGLKSAEEVRFLLGIEKPICFKPKCYVLNEKRLIEEPSKDAKEVHKKIKSVICTVGLAVIEKVRSKVVESNQVV